MLLLKLLLLVLSFALHCPTVLTATWALEGRVNVWGPGCCCCNSRWIGAGVVPSINPSPCSVHIRVIRVGTVTQRGSDHRAARRRLVDWD
jgi:hypothetical protein